MMKARSKNINISSQTLYKPPLLLILGMILLITSCITSATTRQAFAEIMSHTKNNTSPNWRGIEPGKTTEAEFGKIVSTYLDMFEDLRRFQRRPEGTRYIWYDTEFDLPIGVNFHKNVVSYLDLDLPGYSFPFENILNIAGTPIAYMATPITAEIMSIKLLYEEKGVVITFYVKFNPSKMAGINRSCKFEITEGTLVDNVTIYFVEQSDLESMVTTLPSVFTVPGEVPETWAGIDNALEITPCNP